MTLKKSASCVLLPFVFVLSIIGLFFAITDPTTWPDRSVQLSSTDMRLTPRMSTVWCESVAMLSNQDYVIYKVSSRPAIGSYSLSKYAVFIKTSVGPRYRLNPLELKYYLLPGTVVGVRAFATRPNTHLEVYMGQTCQRGFAHKMRNWKSSEESDEVDDSEEGWITEDMEAMLNLKRCDRTKALISKVLGQHLDTPNNQINWGTIEPFHFNVSTEGDYVIVVNNDSPHHLPSAVTLRLTLDRTTYDILKTKESVHICTSSSACVVPLSFGSSERTVVWVPAEDEAGRHQYVISTRCRPRIALFALLTVLVPVMLFAVLSFIIKMDKSCQRGRRHQPPLNDNCTSQNAPFLPRNGNHLGLEDSMPSDDIRDLPPSYELVYHQEQPPPYSSLKTDTKTSE